MKHSRQNLAAGGDAVRKMADADDEGQRPDEHDGAGDGMAAADKPCDHGNDPAADNAAPENMANGKACGFHSESRKGIYIFRLQSAGAHGEHGEKKRANDIRRENHGPEAHGVPEVAAFGEHKRYGIQSVFSKELSASEDDSHESHGIKAHGDELSHRAVAEL